jgi:hypothetical protein
MTTSQILARIEARGFFQQIEVSGGAYDFTAWCSPDADLDDRFPAICGETGEAIRIDGWACLIEVVA